MDANDDTFNGAKFMRASACNFDPICVEVAMTDDAVAVRDSKDPSKPPHVFNKAEWAGFVAGVKAGEFDV